MLEEVQSRRPLKDDIVLVIELEQVHLGDCCHQPALIKSLERCHFTDSMTSLERYDDLQNIQRCSPISTPMPRNILEDEDHAPSNFDTYFVGHKHQGGIVELVIRFHYVLICLASMLLVWPESCAQRPVWFRPRSI